MCGVLACVYVCVWAWVCERERVCVYISMHVGTYVRMNMSVFVYVHAAVHRTSYTSCTHARTYHSNSVTLH